jgi:isoleucyl-tRNA synthetase
MHFDQNIYLFDLFDFIFVYFFYRNLYVHGFVVDEQGKKMSKSVGNVTSPSNIISGCSNRNQPAYGADVLRWWVATQGSADGCNISVSTPLLRSSDESVQKLRNVIKFLISYCNEASAADLHLDKISYDELMYTDQYMLSLLRNFRNQVNTKKRYLKFQ